MKMVIVGLGNTLLSDDGAGIQVVRRIKKHLSGQENVQVVESNWGGFRIIDLLSGYHSAIIVDAIKTGTQPPGFIHVLDGNQLVHSVRMVSFHDINFATAVEFARELNIPMPEQIVVYAIEVLETEYFSEHLTPAVESAVEKCTEMILNKIHHQYPIALHSTVLPDKTKNMMS
ncbi:MAG: hydrogenase maturation protease [Methanobacteriota archaeon]|nr:MAG: hydrogenase maturation protease [Euryarchaeota archaeon]